MTDLKDKIFYFDPESTEPTEKSKYTKLFNSLDPKKPTSKDYQNIHLIVTWKVSIRGITFW